MRAGCASLVGAALAAVLAGSPAFAAQPTEPSQAQQPAIDPQADELLRKMSQFMSGLQSFKFTTNSVDEAVTKQGQKLQFLASQQVSIRRPDKLRSERVGPVADTILRYDGRMFSVYGNRTGYYATAPAPGRLDAAIDSLRARYNIDAPGADLLVNDPYHELMDGVTSGLYLGLEPINGVMCHHLAFRSQDVDWQIWIQDGPQPLPRRYQITTKTLAGQPGFAVDISNWETQASLPDDVFAFQPPAGAQKIDLQPSAAR